MNPHYTYLMVNLACLAGPLLLSFHPRLRFYKEWPLFIGPCLLTAAFFLIWDGLFTRMGVWGFNPDYVIGIFLAGMPLEEYLFFICIPFACSFSYHAFGALFTFPENNRTVRILYGVIAAGSFTIGLRYIDRWYTATTFLLLGTLLCFLLYNRAALLVRFLFTYLFILIPFLLSNGVLTGSFLHRVIVWYNNAENLGLRLLTIPVEDAAYAMVLLLLNIGGYELLKRRRNNTQSSQRLTDVPVF